MSLNLLLKLIKWTFIILIPIGFALAWLPIGLFEDNAFLLSLATQARTPSIMRFNATLFLIVLLIVVFLKRLWFYRCKNCKKLWGLQKKSSFLAKTEEISVAMTTKRRNNAGEVIGEDEQYVPGKRYHYATPYVCKYCGKGIDIIRVRDKASI